MAKKVHAISLKGNFELDTMEVTEESKEGIFTYDFLYVLKEFDGKLVSITVKEENPVKPKDAEANVPDDSEE
jgi:hypothetical protein